MKINRILALGTAMLFVFSLMVFSTSCRGGKNSTKGAKVKSGSGMGNKSHKNKHVWGK